MIFKKNEVKYLWPFYLNAFILGLAFMMPPYFAIYFMKLGYSYFQVTLILAANVFSMFIFEVPTGAFADSFSRKYSVILGLLIVSIAATCVPLKPNFHFTILLWLFAGLGVTFISGAREAMVIDNLNAFDRKDLHQEYFIKSASMTSLGSILGSIIGALLVQSYSMRILWFIFGAGYFLAAIILLLFTKENFSVSKPKLIPLIVKSYRESKEGLHFTFNDKTFLMAILAGLFMELMFIGMILIPTFLVSLGMAESQLGYMFSINGVIVIIMSFLSRRISKFKVKNVMTLTIILHMILLFSFLFIFPPFFYLAGFVYFAIQGLMNLVGPVIQVYFHKIAHGRIRATVMSAKGMITTFISGLTLLGSGYLMDLFGPQKVLAFSSLFGFIAISLYQKIKD